MAYIGSTPTSQNFISGTDYFNGTGSQTTFTLTRFVNSVNDVEVVVNNVIQQPNSYTVSGTTLTLSAAPSSGTSNVYVRYLATNQQSFTVGNNTVGYNQLTSDMQSKFAMKNRLINGAMLIWQRGTTTSTNGAYIADRFAVYSDSGTITGSQSTDTPSTAFKYSLSVSGSNYPQTWQRIESLNTYDLVGQTVTISFWLKQTSGAGTNSIGVQLLYANAADNFSSRTAIQTTTVTATSSWAQYTVTVPNLSANTVNGLQLLIYGNTSGSATFLVTGVQLEVGTSATGFEYRQYQQELALCQRYAYALQSNIANYFQATSIFASTTVAYTTGFFPVTMRAVPSLTTSAASNYQLFVPSASTYYALTLISINGVSNNQFFLLNTNIASGGTAGQGAYLSLAIANTPIIFSAEL